ncbi:MAG: RluA family pseudouridine synthase, partial [Myxococcota bacterium]
RQVEDLVSRGAELGAPQIREFRVPNADGAADSENGSAAERPVRLDHFLTGCDLGLSRSQLRRLIDAGDVAVAGRPVRKPGHKLRLGDRVAVTVRPARPIQVEAQDIPLVVLYEDEHLIAVDKPAGLVVHPAPGHPDRTLVNALLAHCRDLSGIGGELRPGIVHRLDKDTSGVMVATKSDAAHTAMAELFRDHDLSREYLAVVAPAPRDQAGRMATLHGRHPVHRKKFSSRVSRGKRAVTHYRVVERFAGAGRADGGRAAVVRCRLETGRTHQIRVHFADHGWPLLGDPLYGRARGGALGELATALGRQALHAAHLAFVHPMTGAAIELDSAPPADMQAMMAGLRALSAGRTA